METKKQPVQFHAESISFMKDEILQEIFQTRIKFRATFVTSALGMGIIANNSFDTILKFGIVHSRI